MNNDGKVPNVLVRNTQPMPWKCGECREKSIDLAKIEYSIKARHDGREYTLYFPDLEVGKCRNCGHVVMWDAATDRIDEALVKAAGLLSPERIRENLHRLQLTPAMLAEDIGVKAELAARWAEGLSIQSAAHDRLMRLYFSVPAAREFLGAFELKREFDSARAVEVSA